MQGPPAPTATAAERREVRLASCPHGIAAECPQEVVGDFRLEDATTKLGIPSAKLWIVDGVNRGQRLLEIVGIANAKGMLYPGERYDAARALSMGLVDEISDDAVSGALAFAGMLASNAPLSIAGAKFMLNGLSMGEGGLDVAAAQRLIDLAADSEDFREGRRAFAEKRAPRFRGR